MHIALVVPDLTGRNGWSRYATDLGRALHRHGHRVSCLVYRKEGVDWAEEYVVFSDDAHNALRAVGSSLRMRKVMRRLQPNIVHFIAEPYALTLPLIGRGPWRAYLTLHGTYAAQLARAGGPLGWLVPPALSRMHAILSVSQFTKDYTQSCNPSLARSLHLSQQIRVMPNAVDLTGTTLSQPHNTAKQILSVGALKARKGQHLVIEACALLRKHYNVPFHYRIIGSPDQNPEYVAFLHQRIRELELQDCVELAGNVPEAALRDAYRSGDLFIMLSQQEGDWFEGFGLVFLEANAWGIPVIGPTSGGCPEAIHHGRSGYVCDPKASKDVAARMADILLNQQINRADCRRWAEEHSMEQFVQQMEELYGAR